MRHYTALVKIRRYDDAPERAGATVTLAEHTACFSAEAPNLETAREDIFAQARARHPGCELVMKSITCERTRR